MRVHPFATALLWLIATVALTVAIPTTWTQQQFVDADGYAALATSSAEDPRLQDAMTSLLTTQVQGRIPAHHRDTGDELVHRAASAYTASPAFPREFAQTNRLAHQWLFTDGFARTDSQLSIDLAPMLSDPSLRQTLVTFDRPVPDSTVVPVMSSSTVRLHPGQFEPLTRWGPLVSGGTATLAAVAGLLTIAAARSRPKAVAALGVSALLAGAGGWAWWVASHESLDSWLSFTTVDIRQITEVLLDHGSASLHVWLNLTLAAGGLLVAIGVVVSILDGGNAKSRPGQDGIKPTHPATSNVA